MARAEVEISTGFWPALGRFIASRYDWKSPVAFLVLVSTAALVGYHWRDLLDANGEMDALLASIWILMAALITWRVRPRRDLLLVAVGAVGGGVIEWWGTNTGIWSYFTDERPPLWILPAWPIAALSVDRLSGLVGWVVSQLERRRPSPLPERNWRVVYYVTVSLFVVWMTHFVWGFIPLLSTQIVLLLMVVVTVTVSDPQRDVVIFMAGALLGILLEYWGTSRQCWTYYTHEVPPPVAVVAHGFAALAFGRGADALVAVLARVRSLARPIREA